MFLSGAVYLSDLSHLVIDEADTMFDASFMSLAVEILKYSGVCAEQTLSILTPLIFCSDP